MSEPLSEPPEETVEDALVLGATPGRVVAGRYRLSRALASGGMGQVWRAYDEVGFRPVAIKLLRPEFVEDPNFVERFRAEARSTGLLDHPGIAHVYDYGERADLDGRTRYAFLVLEMIDGESLAARLRRSGRLPTADALDILGQAALALQAAHEAGVVHRDVKPANLLICPDGTVKVTDFGIARATGALALTRTGTVLGTAHYLSPEQVSGRPASAASDVYALGVVAFECLCGRRPFEADSPIEVALSQQRDPVPALPEELPAPVRDLVLRALAKDPAGRPTSAGSFGRTALGLRDALYGTGADGDAFAQPLPTTPAPVIAPMPSPSVSSPRRAASPSRPAGLAPTGTLPTTPPAPRAHQRSFAGLRLPSMVLGVLVVGVGAFAALHHGGHATAHASAIRATAHVTASTAPNPAGTVGPSGVAVNPAALSGLPAATAVMRLDALGLHAVTVSVEQSGKAGTVVTVVTAQNSPLPPLLAPGSTVDVQVVAAP